MSNEENNGESEGTDLEGIARSFANMDKEHKIDQIMPFLNKAIYEADFMMYEDENGIPHVKTELSEKEAEKLGDIIYDTLAHHTLYRGHKGLKKDEIEKLQELMSKFKDTHDGDHMDNNLQMQYGISRKDLKKELVRNKENLDSDTLSAIVGESIKHHRGYHAGKISENLNSSHVEGIKQFIYKNVDERKLDPTIKEKISGIHELKEIIPYFRNIANAHYKDHKKEDKKEYNKLRLVA
ncbi:hypothetical protein ACFLTH_13560 [Bacteroidota bacterium]